MHYMPWFESAESTANGRWGLHWTMANRDPDQIVEDRREIAAHYYPLIGPYASGDKDVLEYHLLLMKLAGIDGILVDWYGSHDVNDYRSNRNNTEALIEGLHEVGLQFAVVYEDYSAGEVAANGAANTALGAARGDMSYLAANYFNDEHYIEVDGAPLLLVFGPRLFETEAEWAQVFTGLEPKPHLLTLWHQSGDAGQYAAGEFAWVYNNHLQGLDVFYRDVAPKIKTPLAVAYPGFRDFYAEGGWGSALGWQIEHDQGRTFAETLLRAQQSGVDAVQLVTWNDFGEGTMIEPTREFGFSFLEQVQRFAGVEYGRGELERVYELYQLRKKYAADVEVQRQLDQVFNFLASLAVDEAAALLDGID
jgi:hypothetical protein